MLGIARKLFVSSNFSLKKIQQNKKENYSSGAAQTPNDHILVETLRIIIEMYRLILTSSLLYALVQELKAVQR